MATSGAVAGPSPGNLRDCRRVAGCLPVHLGKLSCRAEVTVAGDIDGQNHVQVG